MACAKQYKVDQSKQEEHIKGQDIAISVSYDEVIHSIRASH